MHYHRRLIEPQLLAYVDAFPCVLLTGARQTGKSTLLQHCLGNRMKVFTFDPVQDLYGERRDPDLFLRNHPPPLILDEIQYVPSLVAAVKRWIDADRRPGQFVLTGSRQWQVMRHLSESLAGRTALLELSGFSLSESHEDPGMAWLPLWLRAVCGQSVAGTGSTLLAGGRPITWSPAETLWRGTMPEPTGIPLAVVPGWMKGYVATYVQRDVRMQQEIRDEEQFGRFLGLCAALTAQEVNQRELGREVGSSAPTAGKWLDVLKAGRQWLELPAYARNLTQRLSRKPKGHLADTGLACHLLRLPEPHAVSGSPAFGALFETLVVTDLIKQCAVLETEPAFHHYRQHSGAEVDLVIEYAGRLFPVEVKASARVRPSDANGIAAFQAALGPLAGEGLVVYAGGECLRLAEHATAVPLAWSVACE
jgi:hypothetical protein